jgi:hypothetical protein
MTSLEIKKVIIKDIITPFFKNNGFAKKGIKYFKNINHLIIEAGIQSLRYYKKENTDEFRIVIKIYPDNSAVHANMYFGGYHIPRESSHIIIDENSDIEELKTNIQNELNNLLVYLTEYNNIEKILYEQKEYIKKLNDEIIEYKNRLKRETGNENLINIIKNTIKLKEENIDIINKWIKIINE